MLAVETITLTIPSWVDRVALPEYPAMPTLGYVMLATGALLLLIGYFAPIRKFLALMTAMTLMAYYPLALLFYWFLYRFDEKARALREKSEFEKFLREHTHACAWTILGLCAFFGFLFLIWTIWATVRKRRHRPLREEASEDNPFAASSPPPPPAAHTQSPQPRPATPQPRPTAPRPAAAPQAPQVRKVPKKPSPPPSDNPFNFG